MGKDTGVFDVRHLGGITVVSLVGDHDLCTSLQLRTVLEGAGANSCGVVVSLEHTDFIDGSVIRTLRETRVRLSSRPVALALHIPPDASVARIAQITGLCDTLDCFELLDEAAYAAAMREVDVVSA